VRSVPPDVKSCNDVGMVMWARNFTLQEECSDQVNVFIHCFCTRYGTLCARLKVTSSSPSYKQEGMPGHHKPGHERRYSNNM
jgi:hypothetical protein